mmetsp:Transcript_10721/g.21731  ORF Transcript_10721/g.21731 Transcript_10721/m.21731 type:complete len:309 (-) Transcript_10721:118-1044(-)
MWKVSGAKRTQGSARMQVDLLDAALGVVLGLANIVVSNDALRVVLSVEEADRHRRPEEEPRHHVRRGGARVGSRPSQDADGAEGTDAGSPQPCVERAGDALLAECGDVACLHHRQQQVRDATRKARDKEREDIGDGTVGVEEIHAADDGHEEEVVEHVVGVELEGEHVVEVHRDDDARGPIGASGEGERLAVLDAHRRRWVARRVHKIRHAEGRDDEVAECVQQEPTGAWVRAARPTHSVVDQQEWQQRHDDGDHSGGIIHCSGRCALECGNVLQELGQLLPGGVSQHNHAETRCGEERRTQQHQTVK